MKIRADGRYRRSIIVGWTAAGKQIRRYVYGYSIKELEDRYAELRDSLNKGTYTNDEGMTVGQWAEMWRQAYKSDRSINTKKMYEKAIKNHIGKNLGHIRLRDVSQYQCRTFLGKLTSGGHYRTAAICRITLIQMFDDAVEDNLMQKNPARKIKLGKPPKPDRRRLTDEEISALLSANLTHKERAFVMLGLYCGLRKGEALALKANDIDLSGKWISIDKAVEFIGNQSRLKHMPKTDASIRNVPLFPPVYHAITKYLSVNEGAGALFTMYDGKLMSETSYRRMWSSIVNKMKSASNGSAEGWITSKMMRHTYATLLYYSGIDLKQAQAWMGHAGYKMLLEVYTHLDKKKETGAREKFMEYLGEGVSRGSNESIYENASIVETMNVKDDSKILFFTAN